MGAFTLIGATALLLGVLAFVAVACVIVVCLSARLFAWAVEFLARGTE